MTACFFLTLFENGVGAVLLLPARCFSRWLSARGKASAYRRPPSDLEQTKNVSDWSSHPSQEPVEFARPAPAPRLEAAVGPGLLRRCPMPPRRVGLCQPRVPWGPRARLWPQGEKRSGFPRAVHFPELWDLHPGLGSDIHSLLWSCGEVGSGRRSLHYHWKGGSSFLRLSPFNVSDWPVDLQSCILEPGACTWPKDT